MAGGEGGELARYVDGVRGVDGLGLWGRGGERGLVRGWSWGGWGGGSGMEEEGKGIRRVRRLSGRFSLVWE